MKVTPTPPIAATTPRSSQHDSPSQDRSSSNSRPSASDSGTRPNDEKVFRAHDRQPTLSADTIITSQREHTERLEKLVDKLTRTMTAANAPSATIGSAAPPPPGRQHDVEKLVEREIELGKLERTIHPNGDVSYRLPLNSVRNLGYELIGKREAFVDRGDHLEVSSGGDHHMRAATLHAARKWGGDPVVIYAEGKHLDRAIAHAVRAGLVIANESPVIVAKVAAERERQANPLQRERAAAVAQTHQREIAPIIARVRAR